MPRYEYDYVTVLRGDDPVEGLRRVVATLNALGDRGWKVLWANTQTTAYSPHDKKCVPAWEVLVAREKAENAAPEEKGRDTKAQDQGTFTLPRDGQAKARVVAVDAPGEAPAPSVPFEASVARNDQGNVEAIKVAPAPDRRRKKK